MSTGTVVFVLVAAALWTVDAVVEAVARHGSEAPVSRASLYAAELLAAVDACRAELGVPPEAT